MFFVCAKCGKEHMVTERHDAPPASEEVRSKLRLELERLESIAGKNSTNEMQALKASIAYYGSAGGNGSWKLPETITTSQDKESQFFFHCIVCP